MRAPASHLSSLLRAQNLPSFWAVTGDEPLFIEEAVDEIRAAFRHRGISNRETHLTADSVQIPNLLVAAATPSLFSSNRLVEIRLLALPTGKSAADLFSFPPMLPEGTHLLLILPPTAPADRKASWYQALAQSATLIETQSPPQNQLAHWWRARLQRQNQQASEALLADLVAATEGNLLAAKQYLDLLALLFPAGPLPDADVRALIVDVAHFDPFALRAAILARDTRRAVRLLTALAAEGVPETLVLWAISAGIRTLARIAEEGAVPAFLNALGKEERLFSPSERAALAAAARDPYPQAVALLGEIARLDRIVKGVESGDFWREAVALVARLSPKGK
ncbi:MAG: DNA polymerase III subunit delta [Hydrogenophilus sp.]|nr:DNA polymerase III subunit delta [Hydrogenophilus sp.]